MVTEKIIEKYHFTLSRVRQIPEMEGSLWEMEHPKSGAKLCWLPSRMPQSESTMTTTGISTTRVIMILSKMSSPNIVTSTIIPRKFQILMPNSRSG